jgi:transcriptional regulator with XRE-family HTH domain
MKYPEIARRFTEILNEKGWRAQELADRSGMTKAAISHYVNGKRCPTNKTATELGRVLGVNPLWLMDLSEQKTAPDVIRIPEGGGAFEIFDSFRDLPQKSQDYLLPYIKALIEAEKKRGGDDE